MRPLLAVLACALISLGASSCNPEPIDDLLKWAGKVTGLADDVDNGILPVTEFRPPPPPPRSELREIDLGGLLAGTEAKSSANRMREGTNLSQEEAENIACFLFAKALDGELTLDPELLEIQVLEYIGERFEEAVPQEKFRGDVEDLAESIEEADNGGEAALETAMATACA